MDARQRYEGGLLARLTDCTVKALCIAAAGICLLLGLIGAVVPLLPTTPFVLLAGVLLIKANPKWRNRLFRSAIIGPVLNDWQQHRGVRRRTKRYAIASLLTVAALTYAIASPKGHAAGSLAAGTLAGLIAIVCLPVTKPSGAAELQPFDFCPSVVSDR